MSWEYLILFLLVFVLPVAIVIGALMLWDKLTKNNSPWKWKCFWAKHKFTIIMLTIFLNYTFFEICGYGSKKALSDNPKLIDEIFNFLKKLMQ